MPLDLKRIRALCFDVDGTLADTDDLYAQRFASVMRHFPWIRDPDQAARKMVMRLESPANAVLSLEDTIGVDGLAIPLIDWAYRHIPHRRTHYLVIPGVISMLPRLKERFRMAVISARDELNTMSFLDQCNLSANFDVILTALSARHTKPYPDPILLAARRLEVAPEECVMIGDTTVDIRAGKAAGAQTVGVLCGFGQEQELQRARADLIVLGTADVEQVLLGK